MTPGFFCSNLSSFALFSCTFLSFGGVFLSLGDFSHLLSALHYHSPIVCFPPPSLSLPLFCHHPSPCQSAHFLPSSPPFFSFSYFYVHPFICHFFFPSQTAELMSGWIEPSHYCVLTDWISEATHISRWVSHLTDLEAHAVMRSCSLGKQRINLRPFW